MPINSNNGKSSKEKSGILCALDIQHNRPSDHQIGDIPNETNNRAGKLRKDHSYLDPLGLILQIIGRALRANFKNSGDPLESYNGIDIPAYGIVKSMIRRFI